MLDEAPRYGDSAADKVEAWRFEELIAAGYPLELADQLATRTDVDLHQAVDIVEIGGCSPELAADILL